MAENTTEMVVGGVVLAAAIGFGIYAAQIAGINVSRQGANPPWLNEL